ncbi:MAG TPA: SurA N-terminal domain-containing protein [Pyrinomonadaceae bacterium]|nr:SurA N-terminal domain-containing protein [Pyrinomonadaceae bacterium]
MGKIGKLVAVSCLALSGLLVSACATGPTEGKDNTVAATVNGRNIMLQDVERAVSAQTNGKPETLNQLQLASARLQILDGLIQREVLYQRAEREKVLPTDAQIETAIATQKQQSGMTSEDFDKTLAAQNLSMDRLREEAKKDLAISALQDKYSGKIEISNREVEDYYNSNRQQFVNARGVALAMIMVDPLDNSAQGIKDDAKNDTDAKLKIDNIYQQLQGKADFATVARARSEDVATLQRGGDVGFFTEEDLKSNEFPPELIASFLGPMQVGDYTQPTRFRGKWCIFKLAEKRLQTENLTLENVRGTITQALTNQRKQILNAALLETALNEAKVVNNLATNMLNNPSNLGLRPVGSGGSQPAASPTATTAASPTQQPTSTPAATTSAPVTVKPAASPAATK